MRSRRTAGFERQCLDVVEHHRRLQEGQRVDFPDFAAGSASSFGIYLAHPLVLQVLLLAAGASYFGAHGGLLGDIRRAPSGLEVLVLLFVAVPVIYALAWVISSAARRTPASLMLTGREYAPRKRAPIGRHASKAGR